MIQLIRKCDTSHINIVGLDLIVIQYMTIRGLSSPKNDTDLLFLYPFRVYT